MYLYHNIITIKITTILIKMLNDLTIEMIRFILKNEMKYH